jgi:hypothetical protein
MDTTGLRQYLPDRIKPPLVRPADLHERFWRFFSTSISEMSLASMEILHSVSPSSATLLTLNSSLRLNARLFGLRPNCGWFSKSFLDQWSYSYGRVRATVAVGRPTRLADYLLAGRRRFEQTPGAVDAKH